MEAEAATMVSITQSVRTDSKMRRAAMAVTMVPVSVVPMLCHDLPASYCQAKQGDHRDRGEANSG